MSDMKCPVCGKQMKVGTLDTDDSMGTVWMSIMPCDCVCSYGASKAVWQELIRTKKQLELATKCINWTIDTFQKGLEHEAEVVGCCELTMWNIQGLEQKDE